MSLADFALIFAFLTDSGLPLDQREVECLTDNIYFEARGESIEGQQAVAHVTLNRVEHESFPDSICGVVHQKNRKGQPQFSWTVKGDLSVNEPAAYENAMMVAIAAMTGMSPDPTKGATHFFDHSTVTPRWSRKMSTTAIIDGHTFKKERM